MTIDSFKYLPRIISYYYKTTAIKSTKEIPWQTIKKPLSECRFGLVTSGGLFDRTIDPPFDVEREKVEPTWGDPTYRKISNDIKQQNMGVSHLHINPVDIISDFNILLPIHRFVELENENIIGSLSRFSYSFMGYQGFPPNTASWEERYATEVAEAFIKDGVDCVLLTPS